MPGRIFQMTPLHRPGCKEVAKTSFSGSRELSSTKLLFPFDARDALELLDTAPRIADGPRPQHVGPLGRTAKSQCFYAWPCAANRDGSRSAGGSVKMRPDVCFPGSFS